MTVKYLLRQCQRSIQSNSLRHRNKEIYHMAIKLQHWCELRTFPKAEVTNLLIFGQHVKGQDQS